MFLMAVVGRITGLDNELCSHKLSLLDAVKMLRVLTHRPGSWEMKNDTTRPDVLGPSLFSIP